jgi:membrane associated rhomboid family serine protease
MTAASVGFQCPECVKEGHRSIRQARTVFGGRVGADARVTKVLIAINVVLFLAQLGSSNVTDRLEMFGFGVRDGEWYRLVTSAFLHDPGFFLHIVFNMYALLMFGSQVERLLGGLRYAVLYLIAALGGSVATYAFFTPYGASLGASGAVFGLFGAYFVLAKRLRADTSQVVFFIGLNLVFGFALHGYINNYAHIGGLLTGGLVAYVYTRVPRGPRQTLLQLGGAAAVALLLVAVVPVRTHQLCQSPPRPPVNAPPAPRCDTALAATGVPGR